MTTVTAGTKPCKKCIDILSSNVAAVQICTVRLSSLKMLRQRSLRKEERSKKKESVGQIYIVTSDISRLSINPFLQGTHRCPRCFVEDSKENYQDSKRMCTAFVLGRVVRKPVNAQAPQAQNTWCMRQLLAYIENCIGK